MSVETQVQWRGLFRAAEGNEPSARFAWRVLRKGGHAFLFLPGNSRFARHAITLYPAQTPKARAARFVLGAALRLRLPVSLERDQWIAAADDEFLKFMSGLVGLPPEGLPTPAVLAGNPAGPGPRYVVLLDDGSLRPVVVVKAGASLEARQLIQAEAGILSRLPADLPAIPRTLASFSSARVEALAQEYFPGDSPRTDDPHRIAAILARWVDGSHTVSLAEAPAWKRLAAVCGSSPDFVKLTKRLAHCTVRPALYHGDFVPWNIKVFPKDGSWIVLDWERGELVGIPAWDWFHYVIQRAILVRRLAVPRLIREVEALLGCERFRAYAGRAAINGIERHLVLAYLLYNNEVIRPAEGQEAARLLLEALLSRWKSD
jgi:hypothetical protein